MVNWPRTRFVVDQEDPPKLLDRRPPAVHLDEGGVGLPVFRCEASAHEAPSRRRGHETAVGPVSSVRLSANIGFHGATGTNRVIEVLSRLASERGLPHHLRSDNGPEFVSKALLRWVANQGLEVALIDPGKPWQNGMVESFNGKFRDECLSMEWFRSRTEAKVVIEDWRRTYNEVRPHSSLGKMTPMAFARMVGNNSNPGATLKN